MIKINLAARKGPTQVSGGTEGGARGTFASMVGLGGGMGKLRDLGFSPKVAEDLKELPFKRIVGICLAIYIANYASEYYQAEEVSKLDQQIAKLKEDQAKLRTELDKTKSFEGIRKSLESDESMMRRKIEVIQTLVADRQKPPKLLLGLSNIMPTDVWLSSFALTATEVRLSGFALSQIQVPEFQKSLNESADFKDVTLLGQSAARDSSGVEVVKFDLQAKRK